MRHYGVDSRPRPDSWKQAGNKLSEVLSARKLSLVELWEMVAKATGIGERSNSAVYQLVAGRSLCSCWWVVVADVLGLKLGFFLDDAEWISTCETAYLAWTEQSALGKAAHRNLTTKAIWTNKLTGEQIDPTTTSQAKEEQPMKAPTTQTKPFPTPPFAPIVELAAQFEVAQKRLAAAAAEHKAAQDALETLRAQLAEAIKA